jgi:hypothetical protein
MGVTYEDAVKAQQELEEKILRDPNVVSIGVIAETNELGEKTGDYVVKVGIISTEDYQSSLAHGDSLIPQEYKLLDKKNAQDEKYVRIQVVKTGRIKALSSYHSEKSDFPSAIDRIPSASSHAPNDHTSKRRPSLGGYSIGHPNVTAGTLGLLLEYMEGPNLGKAFILSNNHVMAANNLAYVGDDIIQPGSHDSGIVGKDTIAILHRWVPLVVPGFNYVDAAIAEVDGGINWMRNVLPYISRIGRPSDLIDAKLDMNVEKTGRTTGYTTGTIVSVNQTVKVTYENMGILIYKNQICTTNMSQGGDSGSCLFEAGTKKPVGLLFAGDDSESFHNPIKVVLSSLSEAHTNYYPSGKTQKFLPDFPLRIIQKRFYSNSASLFSNRIFLVSKNLLIPPTKYGAIITVATSMGLYAATIKLASAQASYQLAKSAVEPSSFALISCKFFRGALSDKTKENSIGVLKPK